LKTFKALKSTPNKTGGFVTKLQAETIIPDAIFGDKIGKTTYYISGSKKVPVDTLIPESALFPKYKITEHEMINTETGESFMGKWLHANV
jgi:hypothetical protein